MSTWTRIAPVKDFPPDSGSCALVAGRQVAIFNYGLAEWFAIQNECPHEKIMCLSRGLIGDKGGEPKVACPMHKNAYSLRDGRHLGGNPDWTLQTFEVKAENGDLYINI